MSEKKRPKRTRDSWPDEQVDLLLEIVKERDIVSKLDSKRFCKNSLLEKEVVPKFVKRNFQKNISQIINKYDSLKSE